MENIVQNVKWHLHCHIYVYIDICTIKCILNIVLKNDSIDVTRTNPKSKNILLRSEHGSIINLDPLKVRKIDLMTLFCLYSDEGPTNLPSYIHCWVTTINPCSHYLFSHYLFSTTESYLLCSVYAVYVWSITKSQTTRFFHSSLQVPKQLWSNCSLPSPRPHQQDWCFPRILMTCCYTKQIDKKKNWPPPYVPQRVPLGRTMRAFGINRILSHDS
jgi:uncharacterized membrane protein (GlpM family)